METTTQNQTYGILGNLILVLKDMHFLKNQKDFFDLLGDNGKIAFNSSAISRAVQYDYYSNTASLKLYKYLEDAQEFKNRLYVSLNGMKEKNESSSEIQLFLIRMKKVIGHTNKYALKKPDGVGTDTFFDINSKNLLKEYFAVATPASPLVHYIYLLIYWSVLKTLPATFSFETNYQIELNEFNTQVLCKYGLGSVAGRRTLMHLASTGNIFALYEVGNMYYYGNVDNQKKNYNQALIYFRKAAGLSVDESIYDAKCNPLALWIVAYMYINYHKGQELENSETIYEIERLEPDDRRRFAIRYCKHAIQLNGCVPALNLLGLIAKQMSELDRNTQSLLPPEEYFSKAAEKGYVYAYNNLSSLEAKAVHSTSDDEEQYHVNKYVEYLTASMRECEPWACKKLGLFYYNGIIPYENANKEFRDRIDKKKSRNCFETAISLYSSETIAWSYVYLMVYFPEKYDVNIALFQEHLLHCCNLQNKDAIRFLCENIDRTYITKIAPNVQFHFLNTLKKMELKPELLEFVNEQLHLSE